VANNSDQKAKDAAVEAQKQQQQLEQEIAVLKSKGGDLERQIAEKEQEVDKLKQATKIRAAKSESSGIATFILSHGLTSATDEPELPRSLRRMSCRPKLRSFACNSI